MVLYEQHMLGSTEFSKAVLYLFVSVLTTGSTGNCIDISNKKSDPTRTAVNKYTETHTSTSRPVA
eukprot:SAG11_NODE_3810_length_2212_cov_1.791765_4_plen_65_part_00